MLFKTLEKFAVIAQKLIICFVKPTSNQFNYILYIVVFHKHKFCGSVDFIVITIVNIKR